MKEKILAIFILTVLLAACGFSTTATVQPTSQSTPTPTKNTAVLGAKLEAFVARFGQPTKASQFDQCDELGKIDVTQYPSPPHRISSVGVQSCHISDWDLHKAEQVCGQFLPPDSVLKHDIRKPTAVQRIYRSAMLASEFAAKDFIDIDGKRLQPGTFVASYPLADDLVHVGLCDMGLGTIEALG